MHHDSTTGRITWFKGENEVNIFDPASNKKVEELTYFATDCSIVSNITLCDNGDKLVSLTYNREKDHAYLNSFSVKSEKLLHSLEFPLIGSGDKFTALKSLPKGFIFV